MFKTAKSGAIIISKSADNPTQIKNNNPTKNAFMAVSPYFQRPRLFSRAWR